MAKIVLVDTHTHYNMEPLINDFDSFRQNHDMLVNLIGTDYQDSKVAVDLANRSHGVWCSVGIHPNNVVADVDKELAQIEQLIIDNPNVICAVGECGLDYYYEGEFDKEEQAYKFKKQIELAIKYRLPLQMHIREAHEDAIKILTPYKDQLVGAIVHCYTDNYYYAKIYESMGFYISFSGVLTFRRSQELRKIASEININQILTETDAPYLSPEPFRGKQNSSPMVHYTNQCLAELRGLSIEEMNKKLYNNAHLALKLKY